MRDKANIPSLRERSIALCDKFANKCLADPRFSHWFPEKSSKTTLRQGKTCEKFREDKARCDRLFYSPIFYFWRRLNGKTGNNYGMRNAQYRD